MGGGLILLQGGSNLSRGLSPLTFNHWPLQSIKFVQWVWAYYLLPSVLLCGPGGRILRRTLSVRHVIVTERHVAPPSELQWHTCTFRHALRAAYRTAISAAQILVWLAYVYFPVITSACHSTVRSVNEYQRSKRAHPTMHYIAPHPWSLSFS